jgi:hypothetical protein
LARAVVAALVFLGALVVPVRADGSPTVAMLSYEGFSRGMAVHGGFKVVDPTGPTITLPVPVAAFPVEVVLDPDPRKAGDEERFVLQEPPDGTVPDPDGPTCDPWDTIVIGHSNARLWGDEMARRHGWYSAGRDGQDLSQWSTTVTDPTGLWHSAVDLFVAKRGTAPRHVAMVMTEQIPATGDDATNARIVQQFAMKLPVFIDTLFTETPSLRRVTLRSRMYGGWSTTGQNGEPWTRLMNEVMRDVAARDPRVVYVDVWELEEPGPELFEDDGVHPNAAGVDWVTDQFESEWPSSLPVC